MTSHVKRSLAAPMTLLALAMLLAVGVGVAAVARTEPLISVTEDGRAVGDAPGPERRLRPVK